MLGRFVRPARVTPPGQQCIVAGVGCCWVLLNEMASRSQLEKRGIIRAASSAAACVQGPAIRFHNGPHFIRDMVDALNIQHVL